MNFGSRFLNTIKKFFSWRLCYWPLSCTTFSKQQSVHQVVFYIFPFNSILSNLFWWFWPMLGNKPTKTRAETLIYLKQLQIKNNALLLCIELPQVRVLEFRYAMLEKWFTVLLSSKNLLQHLLRRPKKISAVCCMLQISYEDFYYFCKRCFSLCSWSLGMWPFWIKLIHLQAAFQFNTYKKCRTCTFQPDPYFVRNRYMQCCWTFFKEKKSLTMYQRS